MNRKQDIVNRINSLSGSKSPYDIFSDWVKMMAISIQNSCCLLHDKTWNTREEEYMKTLAEYGSNKAAFMEMSGMFVETMEDNMTDLLGEIYMESGCGNKNTGQFFTPFNISYLNASALLRGDGINKPVIINEPSCGGGGAIIAVAKCLKTRGLNYQPLMKVVAQDLDWKAVYMCYTQLSLLGIDAVVVQGDTLAEPNWRERPKSCIFRTPRNMGVLL